MRSHRIRSGSAELYYEATGSGLAIILLHAGVADARSWRRIMPALSRSHQVVAYDRRGFGQTTYEPEASRADRDVTRPAA